MALTIRGSYADIFWFSLFHELGHIVNGDISKSQKFIDVMGDEKTNREIEADKFATNALINACDYQRFVKIGDFSISSIIRFAKTQNVMPYIVIGRLQKEERIPYNWFSEYKLRYKWAER
jgi:HTH-type transcriptional regulator/antitoxin HigA